MFLDRQDNKKEMELAYRKELKNQIENKRSRVHSNSVQEDRGDKSAFSLISSFEKEQQQRNKKKEDYYDQLRMQIEEEKRLKNEKQAEKKRKEMEEENKLRMEQQKLQERYQEEMRREKKKNNNPYIPTTQQPQHDSLKEVVKQNDGSRLSNSQNGPQYSGGNVFSNQPLNSSNNNFRQPSPVNLYPNRIQNQAFNYVPRKTNRDNYYRQLLGQRRQLEQQTNQIAELNRLFNAERFRKKQESKGLEELRALQKMLDEKNTSYLSLNFRENQPTSVPSPIPKRANRTSNFSLRANKDTWRKLD